VTLSFGADGTTAGNLAAALERNASRVMHAQGSLAPGYPAVRSSTPRPLWVWSGQSSSFPVALWEQREQQADTVEAQVRFRTFMRVQKRPQSNPHLTRTLPPLAGGAHRGGLRPPQRRVVRQRVARAGAGMVPGQAKRPLLFDSL
jgi:hypothetical protein